MPNDNYLDLVKMDFVEPGEYDEKQNDGYDDESREEQIKTYHLLIEALSKPLSDIDQILADYYKKNPYFPQGKADLMKWNILHRKKEHEGNKEHSSSLVEVYFGGQHDQYKSTDQQTSSSAGMPSNAESSPAPTPAPTSTGSISVLTYALVGAPPTGPSDPHKPGS